MKHKRVFQSGWMIVILVAMALLVVPARAQEGSLIETFDNPSLPGWEHGPTATVVDGALRVETGGFAFHPGQWGDLSLSIRARRTGEGNLAILYSFTDEGDYLLSFGNESLSLTREAGGAVTELGRQAVPTPAGEWVQVGITVGGAVHTITFDGQPMLTAADPNPLSPGGIMLRAVGGAVGEFDDLSLSAGGEAPPVESTAAPEMPSSAASPAPPATATGLSAYQSIPWVTTGGPIGGLGYDIRYNFGDHNIWYVTDAWAGVFMSTDGGLTWFPNNQGITTRAPAGAGDAIPVFSLTVDPINPDIVWLGTQNSGTIYKSTDGGNTWVEKINGVDSTIAPFLSFRGFTVDPTTSDTIYAMGEIASAGWTPDRSSRRGLEMDMTQGTVYKTTNGGENWTEIWHGDNLARYMWIDPRDPKVLYISTGIFDREAANSDVATNFAGGVGILKSTDGGQTWQVLDQDNGLMDLYVGSLYMHPTNPDVLLAGTGENNWSGRGETFTGGVYLTEDGGEHWQRVLGDEVFSAVEFCTSDPNIAYAANSIAVYRSEDGGHTWQRFARPQEHWGPAGIIAGFPIDMQCDPDDPMRIFINNYLGGNFLSTDGGETWVSASQGYTGALVRQLAVSYAQAGTVYAGTRTGLFRSDDGGNTWFGLSYPPEEMSSIMFNEIKALALDPADGQHVLTVAGDMSDRILSSHDGGQSWQVSDSLQSPVVKIVFAPSDPQTVYASVITDPSCTSPLPGAPCNPSGADFLVSHDGGDTWASAAGGQPLGTAILSLVVHPQDPQTVFAGTFNGSVLKTSDGGLTWLPTNQALFPLPVRVLGLDPGNPQILFAGLSQGLYRSADGGLTWSQLSTGLNPEASVSSIAFDPTNSQNVYISDSISGVYVSTDGGATWSAINDGLAHRTANTLALSADGTILYVAIEGGGVYRLGTPSGIPAEQATPAATEQGAPAATAQPASGPAGGGRCPASFVPLAFIPVAFLAARRRRK